VPHTEAELLGEPLQVRPAWHAPTPLAGQQGWPAPPQAVHMFITQRLPMRHEFPQQG
jgi:hypothetical protein